MKQMLACTVALAAIAYSHGRTETVLISGGKGKGPIRVNKSDYDADQADGGEKSMTLYKGKDPTEDDTAAGARSDVNVTHAKGVVTTAAPSAPDFTAGDSASQPPIDEAKNAAAPVSTTVDQLLVMKDPGKNGKYFIANGMGEKITGDRAKLLGIDEKGYDTEEAAKRVQSTTEPSKA